MNCTTNSLRLVLHGRSWAFGMWQMLAPIQRLLERSPGPYGPFGKIHFSKGTVFSDQFSEDLEAAVRAAGYDTQQAQSQGLLDVTLRDLTIDQFQEIFPSTLRDDSV